MPVGTPFAAWPDGTASTGQRDSVLKTGVITQARSVGSWVNLPLMRILSRESMKSAFTAGSAVVGQMKASYFSIIGPKVAYIFAAPSIEARKVEALDFRPNSASSIAYSHISLRCFFN